MQKYPDNLMSDHGLHIEIRIVSDGHYESEKNGSTFMGGSK